MNSIAKSPDTTTNIDNCGIFSFTTQPHLIIAANILKNINKKTGVNCYLENYSMQWQSLILTHKQEFQKLLPKKV